MSCKLAVPVILHPFTVYPIWCKDRQQAAAARLFPEFMAVPTTKISFAFPFLGPDAGFFILGKFRVLMAFPSLSKR